MSSALFILLALPAIAISNTMEGCIFKTREIDCTNFTFDALRTPQINASQQYFENATFHHSKTIIISRHMFINFENVKVLDFSKSRVYVIESGAFGGILHLEKLTLHCNKVSEVERGTFGSLTKLEDLDLSFNLLRSIEWFYFLNLTSLKTLWLNDNNIEYLDDCAFCDLMNLKWLFLYNNNLKKLSVGYFKNLTNLNTLHLSYNEIGDIEVGAFESLINLRRLVLNNNSLSVVRSTWFRPLTKLRRLEIRGNKIVVFDIREIFSTLSSLREIFLNNNLWMCSFLNDSYEVFFESNVLVKDNNTLDNENVYGIACRHEIKAVECNYTVEEANSAEPVSCKRALELTVLVVLIVVMLFSMLAFVVFCRHKAATMVTYKITHRNELQRNNTKI